LTTAIRKLYFPVMSTLNRTPSGPPSGTPRITGTRGGILELLKERGPQTATELSAIFGLTAMGVRQHLAALERDGLVTHRAESRGRGRSTHVYSLTESGDEIFPRTYPELANDLVETTRDIDGDDGVRRLFDRRTERLEAEYLAKLRGEGLERRVAALAKIRTAEGYMADCEPVDGGAYLLRERNCAIFQVARGCPEACAAELDLFRRVLGDASVTRRDHMVKGDRTCTYLIREGPQ
jgi:predicted ArsR family transcriptional regulator